MVSAVVVVVYNFIRIYVVEVVVVQYNLKDFSDLLPVIYEKNNNNKKPRMTLSVVYISFPKEFDIEEPAKDDDDILCVTISAALYHLL